jgi:fructose 1,6-bisphosphate aldolase/phosphatase
VVLTTLSVIKADVGSYAGHVMVHPKLIEAATDELSKAMGDKIIDDFRVMSCGDDLELIMTHGRGTDDKTIHGLAWEAFLSAVRHAKALKLYGAGQDLLSDSFSGTVKGLGPGVAEIQFEERASDPVVVFMADKTGPGAWNLPLFKMFADPFNTVGLIIDPRLSDGFTFTVEDMIKGARIDLRCPQDVYNLLLLLGTTGTYCIESIRSNYDGEIAAVSSTQRLSLIAGRYVGKDDPVCIVRCQSGFPAVGEVLEPFASPFLVPGWMRGSHNGPLMPVSLKDARPTRFDGPPRVIAQGFQIANRKMIGPVDLFDDPAFDRARARALELADAMRLHGPFEPHRLPLSELEYTSFPEMEKRLADRWRPID